MRVRGQAFAWVGAVIFSLVPLAQVWAQEVPAAWPAVLPEPLVIPLTSGARMIWLPGLEREDAVFEMSFGYMLGPGDPRLEAVARAWVAASPAARSAELVAYLSGGEYRRVESPGLAGVQLRVPAALAGFLIAQARDFFDQAPGPGELLDYVLDPASGLLDIEGEAEMELAGKAVSDRLLGQRAGPTPEPADYLTALGTERAWVVISRPPSPGELAVLGQIRPRAGRRVLSSDPVRENSQTGDLVLPSQPEGGVVIGSRIEGVHYEGWFNTLVMDRALARVLPSGTVSQFALSADVTVHLLKTSVLLPLYTEDVRSSMLGGIEGLQAGLPSTLALAEIKEEALAWLGSRERLEWFALLDLWGPLNEGWSRIWSMTEAEFRVSATAFAREARLTALWAPSYAAPSLRVESLGAGGVTGGPDPEALPEAPGPVDFPRLPAGVAAFPESLRGESLRVDTLGSGVTVAEGSPALFVGGPFAGDLPSQASRSGPNGTWWTFDSIEPGVLQPLLEDVRPERLLFFLSPGQMQSRRAILGEWMGSATDATDSRGRGRIATADLPSLLILKVWLDARLIAAGWAGMVEVGIAGEEGSDLVIRGAGGGEAQVRSWLEEASEFFRRPGAEETFIQLRRAAGAWFERLRRDLQVLLWQRAPMGEVPPPRTVPFSGFRNFLDIYF